MLLAQIPSSAGTRSVKGLGDARRSYTGIWSGLPLRRWRSGRRAAIFRCACRIHPADSSDHRRRAPHRPRHRARSRRAWLARRHPLSATRSDEAEALAARDPRPAATAAALPADLADLDDVQSWSPAAPKRSGRPTCLVNNASEFFLDTIGSVTPSGWDTHLDINLKAPVFLAQALYANCRRTPRATSSTFSISACGT